MLDVFGDLITAADHKARMDMRLYAEDADGGLRAAQPRRRQRARHRQGAHRGDQEGRNAKALLDAVPAEARRDVGYIFSRVQFLRRADKIAEAAELMLSVPRDHGQAIDTDQWWIERRLLARKLLDLGDAKTAYRVARDAALPTKENYRVEHQFTAGWIALRFLNDPATALTHFAKIAQASNNPIALARAGYWQGRAAEALGRKDEARAHYEAAARYPTAYYGQIARARLGHQGHALLRAAAGPRRRRRSSKSCARSRFSMRSSERDLVAGIAGRSRRALARTPPRSRRSAKSPRATRTPAPCCCSARPRSARGLPLEHYAFPTIGLPDYRADRAGDRARRRLCDRAPGKHVQSSAPCRAPRRWA